MTKDITSKYELVVGLEIHVQLATKTKIFSADPASFGAAPNEHTSIISLGLPGTLPRLNELVIECAVKMGLATNCAINKYNRFDRKNYFYADLPKGYQITQDEYPICKNGFLDLYLKDKTEATVRINRIHMEEDAGKSIHDQHDSLSLVDLNRAGVPLIEIVSEPDIRSAEVAAAYFTEIRKIAKYLDVSDGNMEEGSMRCDANISVRLKGAITYGNRCEVKNLNSVRNLQKAINYEFQRQISILESGGKIDQNTLNFDPVTGQTSVLRSKEMAYDYRYFPEPDLSPVNLSDSYIQSIHNSLPELPGARKERYVREYELSEYTAELITGEKAISNYFEELVRHTHNYKAAGNWIIGPVMAWINETNSSIEHFPIATPRLAELVDLVNSGTVNNTSATQVLFPLILQDKLTPIKQLIQDNNLGVDTNADDLMNLVNRVLEMYPDKVKEYHNGKKGVIGLFMGDLMKLSKGKVDPKNANTLIVDQLNKLK